MDEEVVPILTPYDVGVEQTERIMNCIPSKGVVAAYSQVNTLALALALPLTHPP